MESILRALVMKTTVCIQAQDTGRILFFKEQDHNSDYKWTWLETGIQYNWHHSGAMNAMRRRISTFVEVMDLPIEWFSASKGLNIVHFRIPEEREVYTAPTYPYAWHNLFEFPEPIHSFVKDALSDLLFLDSLVTRGS